MRGEPPAHDVTLLLQGWGGGDKKSLVRWTPLVYRELRRIASRMMASERPSHTLQATALVNEAYVRLVDTQQVSWQDRASLPMDGRLRSTATPVEMATSM